MMRLQIASRTEDGTGVRGIGMPRNAVLRGTAEWLCLAATPTFAIMALLTIGSSADAICSAMPVASPLSGMALMYVLMSFFHSAPWLKLISRRQK